MIVARTRDRTSQPAALSAASVAERFGPGSSAAAASSVAVIRAVWPPSDRPANGHHATSMNSAPLGGVRLAACCRGLSGSAAPDDRMIPAPTAWAPSHRRRSSTRTCSSVAAACDDVYDTDDEAVEPGP